MSMRDYNKILRQVERYIGSDQTTYEIQLNRAGKHFLGARFKGVFPSDEIPNLRNGHSCIVNLDRSDQGGSHWTAFYGHGKVVLIYDSFGRQVSRIFPNLRFGSGKKLRYAEPDYDAEQDVMETNCGQRSVAFLVFVHRFGVEPALEI